MNTSKTKIMLMLSCTDKTDKKFPELTHFQECSENIKKHVLTYLYPFLYWKAKVKFRNFWKFSMLNKKNICECVPIFFFFFAAIFHCVCMFLLLLQMFAISFMLIAPYIFQLKLTFYSQSRKQFTEKYSKHFKYRICCPI